METFEQYVDEWDKLCGQIADIKRQLKPLTDLEMQMRKAIAQRVQEAAGEQWREGVNNFPLPDGRTLKVTNSIKRAIEEGELAAAAEAYRQLNDVPCEFGELIRIKYEIDKKNWSKLGPQARHAVSRAVVASPQAPEVKLA